MRCLLVVLLLSGCASQGNELVLVRQVDETGIRWIRGVEKNCGGARSPDGCADWSGNPCVITMKEDAPDYVIAHEFRHCFGYVHR